MDAVRRQPSRQKVAGSSAGHASGERGYGGMTKPEWRRGMLAPSRNERGGGATWQEPKRRACLTGAGQG